MCLRSVPQFWHSQSFVCVWAACQRCAGDVPNVPFLSCSVPLLLEIKGPGMLCQRLSAGVLSVLFFVCFMTTASVCELHTMIRKRSESIASSIRCVKERAAPHITLPLFVLGGKSCALVRCSVLRSILQFWHSQSFICDCVVCQQCACDVLKGSWNRALGPMSWYGVDIW